LLDDASAKAGDTVQVSLEPSKEWIEPEVPERFNNSFGNFPKSRGFMEGDYPHWPVGIGSLDTRCQTPETRQKHIEVALDKLTKECDALLF